MAQCNIKAVSAVTGSNGEKLRIVFDGTKVTQGYDNEEKLVRFYFFNNKIYQNEQALANGDVWFQVSENEAIGADYSYKLMDDSFYTKEYESGDWVKFGYVSNGNYFKFTGQKDKPIKTLHFIDENLCAEKNKSLKFAIIHMIYMN